MATPQRNLPEDDSSREPVREPVRPIETRRVVTRPVRQGGRSFFWIWIVLFIAAILWFCGWGFGGYGGWWWGRSAATPVAPAGTAARPSPGGPATGNGATAPRGSAANSAAPVRPAGNPR